METGHIDEHSNSEKPSEQLLNEAVNTLNQINEKLTQLVKFNETLLQTIVEIVNIKNDKVEIQPDSMALLSLPSALRKTAMVLYKLEQATADDLAKETNRMRAVESAAANELFRLGFIKKKRKGHEVYFYIEAPKEPA